MKQTIKTCLRTLRLTERDESLLVDLYLHGAMLRGQIQELHFASSGLRRVNRRLQALAQARLVTGAPLPLGPLSSTTPASAPGSGGQLVYRLCSQAVPIVARKLGLDIEVVQKKVRQGSPTALAHALEIVQTCVVLTHLAKTDSDFTLTRFVPEVRHSWRVRKSDGQETLESFRPDALICFTYGGQERTIFLEVDLGHTSREDWARKRAIAERFVSSGLFARNYGTLSLFAVWALTTTNTRAENLRHAAEKETPGIYRFLTLHEFSEMSLKLVQLA
jgi:Replication-relaxation